MSEQGILAVLGLAIAVNAVLAVVLVVAALRDPRSNRSSVRREPTHEQARGPRRPAGSERSDRGGAEGWDPPYYGSGVPGSETVVPFLQRTAAAEALRPDAERPVQVRTAGSGGLDLRLGFAPRAGADNALPGQSSVFPQDQPDQDQPDQDQPDDDVPADAGSDRGRARRFRVVLHSDPHAHRTIESFLSAPTSAHASAASSDSMPPPGVTRLDGPVDSLTGLLGRWAWDEVLVGEAARHDRYGTPVSVLFADFEGLDALAETFGDEVAARLPATVAGILAAESRASDTIARIAPGRFAVCLAETGEIGASRYARRVRARITSWLEAARVAVALSLSWAGAGPDEPLAVAVRRAETALTRTGSSLTADRPTSAHAARAPSLPRRAMPADGPDGTLPGGGIEPAKRAAGFRPGREP